MKILFVSAEVAPFAKVGGLADVAGALPKALRALGHDVRIVMPLYGMIETTHQPKVVAKSIPISINDAWTEQATISETDMSGVPVYFIGHDRFFKSATSSERVYTPGIDQYLFFTSAVLQVPGVLDWQPDVVHCNDWHTGFVPVLMREKHGTQFDHVGSVFTIHNLAYQGEFGRDILDAFGLPQSLFVPDLLETWGTVNFLKAGCAYSDQVNTVSPTYAREIQTPEFGCKLEGLMKHLADHGRLTGILNGIDVDEFNPATDRHIRSHFDANSSDGKRAARTELLERLAMAPILGAPVIGAVTRLSSQKGLHLLVRAAPELLGLPVQLVVQGLGDPAIASDLRELQETYPNQLRFVEQFDESLARIIYAGSDMFAMPSFFEPCGLGQMIAMRYGTLPIVRGTGGLADTVRDGENGFVFHEKSQEAFSDAVHRAVDSYRGSGWNDLVRETMLLDHSWAHSAKTYSQLYARAASEVAEARTA